MTVVLGYDESPGADGALRVALDVAARFDEPIVVVYGVAPPGVSARSSRRTATRWPRAAVG